MSQKPTVGRIVHFYPGTSPENALPNNMEFAPALVTQVFGGDMANMTIFVAHYGHGAVRQGFSIHHKDSVQDESAPHWVWPPRD